VLKFYGIIIDLVEDVVAHQMIADSHDEHRAFCDLRRCNL